MFALRRLFPTLLFFLTATVLTAAPALNATFDENGLAALEWNGAQFIKHGGLHVSQVLFGDDKGKDIAGDCSNPTISYEATTQRVSHSWPWGAVRCRYRVEDSRLNCELTIENDTAGPMTGIEMGLGEWQFPRRPLGEMWERRFQMLGDNDGDVTALAADFGSGMMTFCNDDPASRLRTGFSPGAQPPQETWFVHITSPDDYGLGKVFIPARSTQTFHLSMRFSKSGASLKSVAGDLFEKYAATYPFQLKWPDRRPIGMLVLATDVHSSPTNPRGWFNEPRANFIGKNGPKAFRKRLLESADRSIAILRDMGAQGMIFWDMEGEEFPNINFVGDPRMVEKLAPEMAPVAREYFARFLKAGLRTGVCIRPSRIVPGWDGKSKWQHSHMGFDVVEEMSQKISYAKKNLGCLLFYVDTNVRYFYKPDGSVDSRLLEGAAFKKLADAHPDVLIIPEIPRPEYWRCTAPYQELRPHTFGGHAQTNEHVRELYPKAFSVINVIDGPAEERRAEIVAGQRRGDILLFRAWFGDPQNKVFKSILKESAAPR